MTRPLAVLLDGVLEVDYHADPALSSTGARLLTPPSTPAHFRWYADHPPEPKDEFDLGHLVHEDVLGVGADLVVVDGHRNRNDVKDALAAARAAGAIPVKSEQAAAVRAAADAVRAHPLAGPVLADPGGAPEQSAWWVDSATGVTCRLRADWLGHLADGRIVCVDVKTVGRELGASTRGFGKSVASYGYHQQADHYLDGLAACGLVDVAWLWVVVELEPPHLVNVFPADPDWLLAARERNTAARDLFARCTDTGQWPGYPMTLDPPAMPRWAS